MDFRGEKRRNQTHESTTDPQARLYRKAHGHEAKLAYLGHVVIENRNALVVGCEVTEALGQHMEREAAARLMADVPGNNERRWVPIGPTTHGDSWRR